MKFYNEKLNENQISDVFMFLNKRLQTMLTEKKPEEELDTQFGRSNNMYGNSMNKANKDLMGGQSPGFK